MTYSMMQGPWTVKSLVTSYLEWDIPRRLVDFRNAWQMDDDRLPAPMAYFSHEPSALSDWPTVITVQMSTSNIERIDYYEGLNPVYRCTYTMRTYVWVRHTDPETLTETRDRLTAVIRAALLDRPCLVKGTEHSGHEMAVDETTMREEYSDITFVKGDRAIAGAYISYDVTLDEAIMRADIANLDTINLHIDASGDTSITNLSTGLVEDVAIVSIED